MPRSRANGPYESAGVWKRRQPCFLQRNLRRAIEAHEEELGNPRADTHNIVQKRTLGDSFWSKSLKPALQNKPPDTLHRLLIVKIKAIVPLPVGSSTGTVSAEALREEKYAAPDFWTSAQIGGIILDNTGQVRKTVPNVKLTAEGVYSVSTPSLKISLGDGPSRQRLQEDSSQGRQNHLLIALTPQECNPSLTQRFKLILTLNLKNTKQGHSILSYMDTDRQCTSSRWIAQWNNILSYPQGYQLLPLDCVDLSSGRQSLGIAFAVSVQWAIPNGTILHPPNDRCLQKGQSVQMKQTGPTCAVCERSFHHIDLLYLHLKLSHGSYNWHRKKTGPSWNFVPSKRTWLDNAEDLVDFSVSKPGELTIVAPQRPFDKRKYLEDNDEHWQLEARGIAPRQQLSQDVQQHTTTKRTYRVPKAPERVTYFRSLTKRPLQEGEEITESDDDSNMDWVQKKQAAAFNNDPTIPSAAKKFLLCFNDFIRGERLFLYERYMEDAIIRFVLAKGAVLWNEDLIGEFVKKARELVEDDIITVGALLECRRILLQKKEESLEKVAVADKVQEDNTANIAPSTTRMPLEPASNAAVNSGTRRIDKGKGKAKAADHHYPTPQIDRDGDVEMANTDGEVSRPNEKAAPETVSRTAEQQVVPLDQCLCGQDPRSTVHTKPLIYCEWDDCDRHVFHIDCVIRHWHPVHRPDPVKRDWYCLDCARNSDTGEEGEGWYVTF